MIPAIQILENIRFNSTHNVWNAGIIICDNFGKTLENFYSPRTCNSLDEAKAEVKQLMEFIKSQMGGTIDPIEYH